MARFDEYFSSNFKPTERAGIGFLGNYVNRLFKANQEQRALEIQAADPTQARKDLQDLQKQRSDLVASLLRGQSSGDSVSTTFTSGRAEAADRRLDLIESNEKKSETYSAAYGATRNNIGRLKTLQDMRKEDPKDIDGIVNEIVRDIQGNFGNRGLTVEGKHGIGQAMQEMIDQNPDIDSKVKERAKDYLSDKEFIPSKRRLQTYQNPTELTAEQDFLLGEIQRGKSSTRQTQKGGMAARNLGQQAVLAEIRRVDQLIQAQRQEVIDRTSRYEDLITNRDRNLALSPIGGKTSNLGRALDLYGVARQRSPEFTETMMRESEEAGQLVVPKQFAGLGTPEGSGATAPIDLIINSTENLSILIGDKTLSDDGTLVDASFEYNLRDEDVQLVRSELERIRDIYKSPAIDKQTYQPLEIQYEDQDGQVKTTKVEIGDFVDLALADLEAGDYGDFTASEYANYVSEKLVDWSDLQKETDLNITRTAQNPNQILSRDIGRIETAFEESKKTGDMSSFKSEVVDSANRWSGTDAAIGGTGAAAFLDLVERQMNTQGDANLFMADMRDIKRGADQDFKSPSFDDELFTEEKP